MVVVRQPVNGCGLKRFGPKTVQVADGHENLERLVLDGLSSEGEEGLEHVVGLLPCRGQLSELAVVLAVRMIHEQVLPDIDAAGDVRPAVGIDLEPRGRCRGLHVDGIGGIAGLQQQARGGGVGDRAAAAAGHAGVRDHAVVRDIRIAGRAGLDRL